MIKLPLVDNSKLGFWKRRSLSILSRKRRNGEVKLTDKNICIHYKRNTIHYYLMDINYLEIQGDLYYNFNPLDLVGSGQQAEKVIHSGNTRISFTINNQKIEINFLITTKTEFNQIRKIMAAWYQSYQFKIREYAQDKSRILLLNPYLSYEEIQSTKKTLGIDSMYE
ncbi:MAG: hypothetical protein ABF242_02500 [Flavobacteriales bacterium]